MLPETFLTMSNTGFLLLLSHLVQYIKKTVTVADVHCSTLDLSILTDRKQNKLAALLQKLNRPAATVLCGRNILDKRQNYITDY